MSLSLPSNSPPAELKKIKKIALEINRLLSELLAAQGITLVDFKIEFGRQGKTICLGDEISMDSMRLWDKKSGESLDKDVYRFEKGDVMATYNRVAQRITKSAPRPVRCKEKNGSTKEKGRIQKTGGLRPKAHSDNLSRNSKDGARWQRLTYMRHT